MFKYFFTKNNTQMHMYAGITDEGAGRLSLDCKNK